MGAEVIVAHMQTDITNLIGNFREFSEAPKVHLNWIRSVLYTCRLYSNVSWYGPVAAVVSAIMNMSWSWTVGDERSAEQLVRENSVACSFSDDQQISVLGNAIWNVDFLGKYHIHCRGCVSHFKYLHYYLKQRRFICFPLCLFYLSICCT